MARRAAGCRPRGGGRVTTSLRDISVSALLDEVEDRTGVAATSLYDVILEMVERGDAEVLRDRAERAAQWLADSSWPEVPDLPGLPDPDPLPIDVLPSALRNVVDTVAASTQTSPDLGAILALAASSAAVGGRFRVRIDDRGWTETTSLYTVAILPPGARKSAVFARYVEPIAEWERYKAREVGPVRRAAEDTITARQRALDAAIRVGEDGEIRDARARLDEAESRIPRIPRILASDSTPEALVRLMAEQGGAIALLAPEGDPLRIADGRYSGDGGARLDELKRAWSGEPIRVDRISRDPVHVPRPALTLGLTLQPGVLESLGNKRSFRGEGVLARILWCRPDPMLGRRMTGADVPRLDVEAERRYARVLRALLDAPTDVDQDGQVRPRTLELDDAARVVLYAYEAEIEAGIGPGGRMEPIADWAAKAAGQAVRVAALLELAARAEEGRPLGDGQIGRWAMRGGVETLRALTPHAHAVLADAGQDERLDLLRYVFRRAGELPEGSSLRDLHRAVEGKAAIGSVDDLRTLLEELEDRGCVRVVPVPTTGPGRPPSPTVHLHPALAEGPPDRGRHNRQNHRPAEKSGVSVDSVDACQGVEPDDEPSAFERWAGRSEGSL